MGYICATKKSLTKFHIDIKPAILLDQSQNYQQETRIGSDLEGDSSDGGKSANESGNGGTSC